MQIGFFVQGEEHLPFAEYLIRSVEQTMPDVDVFQLTDGKCPALGKVIRIRGDMPMGVRRIKHYANLEGDWVFVDTDVLFRKDVRHVFEKPFDVALADRKGTLWEHSAYAKEMPYNFGVVFSRAPEFWRELLPLMEKLPPKYQEWEGEQYLTNQMVQHPRSRFRFEILPSSYNFTPATKEQDVSQKHILHLKGKRKAWISDLAL